MAAALRRIWLYRLLWFFVIVVGLTMLLHLQMAYEPVEREYIVNGRPQMLEVPGFSWKAYWENLRAFPGKLLEGDLQYRTGMGQGTPFLLLLRESWWNTLRLFLYTLTLGGVLGVLIGSLVALRRKLLNATALSISIFGLALPDFLVVIIMHAIAIWTWRTYDVRLWLVLAQPGVEGGWTVPLVTLSLLPLAYAARLTSVAMDEVMDADYIRTARSKGLPEVRVILGHALKNALPRIAAGLPAMMNVVFSSLVVVERMTNWPGLSKWLIGTPRLSIVQAPEGKLVFWTGPTADIMTVAATVFIAWFLVLDGLTQTLRLIAQHRLGEVQQ